MFLHCLNHWKLETPTARKQQMSADELSAYKVQQSSGGVRLKILDAKSRFEPNQTFVTHGTRFTVNCINVT
jgi:hypothetical protein